MLDINELRLDFEQIRLLIPKAAYKVKKADDAIDPTNEEEKVLVDKLTDYLENKCFIWDITNVRDFNFPLPNTVFRENNKIEFKTYEEAEVDYFETFESRSLSKEQLDEIWLKGQFTLKSKIPNLPYIWTLSEWLFKGVEKRKDSWCYDMYLVFYHLYYLRNRFRKDKRHPWFSLTYSVIFLTKGFKDLYALIFGRPQYCYTYINNIRHPDNLRTVLLGKYYENLLRDNPDIVASVYLPKTRTIINDIHTMFLTKWKDLKIYKEHELRGLLYSQGEIKEKIADYKIELLAKEYAESDKLDDRKKKYIIEILIANRLFDKIQNDYDKQYKTEKDALREKLKLENPIRSYSKRWLELLTIEQFQPRVVQLEQVRNERVDKELVDYPRAKAMIKSFITFEKYYDENLKLLAERNTKEANYIAQVIFKHYPPFEVYSQPDYYDKNKLNYFLRTSTIKSVDTLNHFWRWKIAFLRLVGDYHNIIRWGWFRYWNSSFGLRAFCAPYIVTRYLCDLNTGEVKEYLTTYSYISALRYLHKWIKESRDQFESAGDFGFFGKRVGRVINYIENYFLKLILWGFCVTFLYPICIVLMTILSFFMTIFLLVFFTLFRPFLQILFNIFIFDTEGLETIECPCLPFFWIVTKRFIFQFFINFILTICLIFIQIFIGIFMFLFGNLRWVCRNIYDRLTFIIINCNGNIPKVNTSAAWRIAGPGISRSLYYRIEVDDALLLVRAEMEKQQINEYKTKLTAIIEEPKIIHEKISKSVFKNCNAYLNSHTKLTEGFDNYNAILSGQIYKRSLVYPTINNNIRFSKSNLDILLDASLEVIKDFVEKHNLKAIWESFELVPGTYDQLTIKLLKKVFNSENILVNVDETDPLMENQCLQNEEVKRVHKELNLNMFVQKSMDMRRNKKSAFNLSSISGGDEDEETYLEKPISKFGEMHANVFFLRDGKHLGMELEYLDEKMRKNFEKEE
jgi:hypothetical protein